MIIVTFFEIINKVIHFLFKKLYIFFIIFPLMYIFMSKYSQHLEHEGDFLLSLSTEIMISRETKC